MPVAQALRTAEFRVRFLMGSDRGAQEHGWYIDDVEVRVE